MALSIIGAGLGRTGTASLKIALEKLGIGRCYHMSEVLANPEHMGLWIDVANERANFDRIFSGFSATVDFPACIYWRDLFGHYPDAKVILSIRDTENWFRSTQETILGPRWWRFALNGPFGAMCKATIAQFFDGQIHDHDHMIDSFKKHVDAVKAGVPSDRLLIFEAKQGWQPLCEFLDLPVPDETFPHANSERETKALIGGIMASTTGDKFGAEAVHAPHQTYSSDPE